MGLEGWAWAWAWTLGVDRAALRIAWGREFGLRGEGSVVKKGKCSLVPGFRTDSRVDCPGILLEVVMGFGRRVGGLRGPFARWCTIYVLLGGPGVGNVLVTLSCWTGCVQCSSLWESMEKRAMPQCIVELL